MDEFPAGQRLFMTELGEPDDNLLRIVVSEAKTEEVERQIPGLDMMAKRIVIGPDSRHFELVWDRYVAYSVRNESFARFDNDRPTKTGLFSPFTERTASAFLRFIAETTIAADVVGPVRHWELNCLNHCVDIVAAQSPAIRQISETN